MEKIYSPNSRECFVYKFITVLPHLNSTSTSLICQANNWFAVVECGIGFYAIGRNREQALRNGAKWLAAEPDLRTIPVYTPSLSRASLCLCRISTRLAAEIERRGSGCPVSIPYQVGDDGVFDLTDMSTTSDQPQDFLCSSAEIYDRGNA
jgi:hypothetical protein